MFRKLFLSGIAALTFMTPLALTPAAPAHDDVYVYHAHHHRCTVFYRAYPFGPWLVYGVFHSPRIAHQTAEGLRFQGFSTRVVYP